MAQLELPRELLSHPFSPAACGWDWESVKRGNEDVYSNWFLSSSSNDPWICPITLLCSASPKMNYHLRVWINEYKNKWRDGEIQKEKNDVMEMFASVVQHFAFGFILPKAEPDTLGHRPHWVKRANGLVPSCASARDELQNFLFASDESDAQGTLQRRRGDINFELSRFFFFFVEVLVPWRMHFSQMHLMRSPGSRNKYLSRACPCAKTQWSFLQWKVAQAATQGSSWIPHWSSLEAGDL